MRHLCTEVSKEDYFIRKIKLGCKSIRMIDRKQGSVLKKPLPCFYAQQIVRDLCRERIKMSEKRFFTSISVVFICAILLNGCGRKQSIQDVVIENQDILLSEAEYIISQYNSDPEAFLADTDVAETLKDLETVSILKDSGYWRQNAGINHPAEYDDNIVLIYRCSATGLLTSTVDWGFYYTQEDLPQPPRTRYAYVGGELIEEENGIYSCREQGGDNYYWTRKICEHFYYYETGN